MAQGKGGAFERAQRVERIRDAALNLGALRQPFRPRQVGRPCRCRLFERLRPGVLLPRLPAANRVDRAIGDDAIEPRAEVRACLEAAQVAVRLDQTVLNDVFGVLFVAGHPECQPERGPAMALDELAKGLAVALPGAGENGRNVARGHLVELDGPTRVLVRTA